MLNRYLDIAPEVKKALDEGKPVVALESTIISHGMPYPQNKETALKVEEIIRSCGARHHRHHRWPPEGGPHRRRDRLPG